MSLQPFPFDHVFTNPTSFSHRETGVAMEGIRGITTHTTQILPGQVLPGVPFNASYVRGETHADFQDGHTTNGRSTTHFNLDMNGYKKNDTLRSTPIMLLRGEHIQQQGMPRVERHCAKWFGEWNRFMRCTPSQRIKYGDDQHCLDKLRKDWYNPGYQQSPQTQLTHFNAPTDEITLDIGGVVSGNPNLFLAQSGPQADVEFSNHYWVLIRVRYAGDRAANSSEFWSSGSDMATSADWMGANIPNRGEGFEVSRTHVPAFVDPSPYALQPLWTEGDDDPAAGDEPFRPRVIEWVDKADKSHAARWDKMDLGPSAKSAAGHFLSMPVPSDPTADPNKAPLLCWDADTEVVPWTQDLKAKGESGRFYWQLAPMTTYDNSPPPVATWIGDPLGDPENGGFIGDYWLDSRPTKMTRGDNERDNVQVEKARIALYHSERGSLAALEALTTLNTSEIDVRQGERTHH